MFVLMEVSHSALTLVLHYCWVHFRVDIMCYSISFIQYVVCQFSASVHVKFHCWTLCKSTVSLCKYMKTEFLSLGQILPTTASCCCCFLKLSRRAKYRKGSRIICMIIEEFVAWRHISLVALASFGTISLVEEKATCQISFVSF